MLITFDTDKDNAADARALAGFLIHVYELDGDETEVPEGTTFQRNEDGSPVIVPSPKEIAAPPPPSNVIDFPVPPSPAFTASPDVPAPSADIAAVTAQASTVAPIAAAAQSAVSALAEYDSAGMPWDARIHQKAKGQKRDGTWKLIKGVSDYVVLVVTTELASRKIATTASPSVSPAIEHLRGAAIHTAVPVPPPFGAVPPPPATVAPQVSLPPDTIHPSDPSPGASVGGGNPVPLPPIQGNPVPTHVSTQPLAAPVPVPPVSAVGGVGAVSYRSLIDKMTAGTRAQILTAAKVLEIVQACGCPNLQQLNQMPGIFPDVDARLELALAGL